MDTSTSKVTIVGVNLGFYLETTFPRNVNVNYIKEFIEKKSNGYLEARDQTLLLFGKILQDEVSALADLESNSIVLHLVITTTSFRNRWAQEQSIVIDELSIKAAKSWIESPSSFKTKDSVDSLLKVINKIGDPISPTASAPEVAPALPNVEVQIQPPRWIDFRKISRIAVFIFLFGQGLPSELFSLMITTLVMYYLMDTGIMRYINELLKRRNNLRQQEQGRNPNQNENIAGAPNEPRNGDNRVLQGAGALQRNFSLTRLPRVMITIPAQQGIFLDVLSVCMGFCLSLIPGWNPDGTFQL